MSVVLTIKEDYIRAGYFMRFQISFQTQDPISEQPEFLSSLYT